MLCYEKFWNLLALSFSPPPLSWLHPQALHRDRMEASNVGMCPLRFKSNPKENILFLRV